MVEGQREHEMLVEAREFEDDALVLARRLQVADEIGASTASADALACLALFKAAEVMTKRARGQ